MGQLSLLVATSVMALFGWSWVARWFHWAGPTAPQATVQHTAKSDDSYLQADGSVQLDAEFDADLNSLNADLSAAQGEGDSDLNAIEQQ